MEPLIVLAGPTAVGKTELSLSLAEALGGEIISADSMQVYRGMDIGTAKLPLSERRGIPHHLIDVVDPTEVWDLTRFLALAKAAAADIRSRGKLPILVGGTGFYIQAFLKDLSFEDEERDDGFRAGAEERSAEELYAELSKIDPESATIIPMENKRRVIRALEYWHYHGETISEHNRRQKEAESPYRYLYAVLTMDRAKLYERVEMRVDMMIQQGLPDEVARLLASGVPAEAPSMQGLGYRQMVPFVRGKCSLEEAATAVKLETRHFAKRQLTWFRREPDAVWFDKDGRSEADVLSDILAAAKERGILSRNID